MITGRKSSHSKLTIIRQQTVLNTMKADDIFAMSLLKSLTEGRPYLPFTGSAIRPFCMAHIINNIILNHRQNILEFGSGISTILIARLISRQRADCRVISIDHDLEWIRRLQWLLKEEELEDYVHLVHAPLKSCKHSAEGSPWYDTAVLDRELSDRVFDLVVIDGPPAWEEGQEMARYPAMVYIFDRLNESFTIYLDDANRQGEQQILARWQRETGLSYIITGGTMGVFTKGRSFYLEPSAYYMPD